MLRTAWLIAAALAWLAAGPARAQDAAADAAPGEQSAPAAPTARAVITAAAEKLRAPGIRRPCPLSESGVIIVCAQDDSGERVESTSDQAIAAGQSLSDGVPRAPDQFGIPGGGVSIRIGAPPPPVLMIDLKAIPEAPAGSDAARYADESAQTESAPAESARPESAE